MKLIGMLDSPYVRRVAISLKLLSLSFEHLPWSVFRTYEQFRRVNPLVKAPTLICDDGMVLTDSTLILAYIEQQVAPERRLMPVGAAFAHALHVLGIALTACEKTVQVIYEHSQRPAEKRHQPWLDRVTQQLLAAYALLEAIAAQRKQWLLGDRLTQADITVAVAWRFTQSAAPRSVAAGQFPQLCAFSEQAERLPEFLASPLD